jgi:hypothetical protein
MVAVGLYGALAACHGEAKRHIVRVEVFEDHVSIDGVVSTLPIQLAVDAQTKGQNVFVLLTAQQSLSAPRTDELTFYRQALSVARGRHKAGAVGVPDKPWFRMPITNNNRQVSS